jgi:hypothetical protein
LWPSIPLLETSLSDLNSYGANGSLRNTHQQSPISYQPISNFEGALVAAHHARMAGFSAPKTEADVNAFYSQDFYWSIIADQSAACGDLILPSMQAALYYGPRGTTKAGLAPGQRPPVRMTLTGQPSATLVGVTEIDYSNNPSKTASNVERIYFLDDQGHRQRIDMEQTHYSTTGGASWHPYDLPSTPAMERMKTASSKTRLEKTKRDFSKCSSWCTLW